MRVLFREPSANLGPRYFMMAVKAFEMLMGIRFLRRSKRVRTLW